jgi:hypothetical protein
MPHRQRKQKDKSFLVLFFKKELLFAAARRPTAPTTPTRFSPPDRAAGRALREEITTTSKLPIHPAGA